MTSARLPFQSDQVERDVSQAARDVMLNCILAWAALDGALSMLLARVSGMSYPDAAEAIGRESGTSKLNKIRDVMLEAGAIEVAALIRKHKKAYEKRIVPRNRIAHAKLAGAWKNDSEFLVFAVFERHQTDSLAIDLIPLQEIKRSAHWANALTAMALRVVDADEEWANF